MYLSALLQELSYLSRRHKTSSPFSTVYFGGGTPSMMTPSYIEAILRHTESCFGIRNDAEITIETNPGTVSPQKLQAFRSIGINRISIGIQSFHQADLAFLTRIHTAEEAVQTVHDARAAGFENINVDLIFNLPGQTKEKWRANLLQAAALPVTHISAYSLIVEKETVLHQLINEGSVSIQGDSFDRELYEQTIEILGSNGFAQYEVSNFARSGFACRHNLLYWRYNDYYAAGTAAHSFLAGVRRWNHRELHTYIHAVQSTGNAFEGEETITAEQRLEEYIMLALRSTGIDLADYQTLFHAQFLERNPPLLQQCRNAGLITVTENTVSLTPKGYCVCDEIAARFLSGG